MSEATNGTTAPEPVKVSRIVIAFPNGQGTSELTLHPESVDEGQVLAAAYMLDLYARDLHAFVQAQRLALAAPQGLPRQGAAPDVMQVIEQLRKGH